MVILLSFLTLLSSQSIGMRKQLASSQHSIHGANREVYAPAVLHTLAYLVGTLPLGLKGRFYAKLVFVSKGKILRHCCLYVLNGNILRQTNDAKPNT